MTWAKRRQANAAIWEALERRERRAYRRFDADDWMRRIVTKVKKNRARLRRIVLSEDAQGRYEYASLTDCYHYPRLKIAMTGRYRDWLKHPQRMPEPGRLKVFTSDLSSLPKQVRGVEWTYETLEPQVWEI